MRAKIGQIRPAIGKPQHRIADGGGARRPQDRTGEFLELGDDVSLRHRAFRPAAGMDEPGIQHPAVMQRDLHIGIARVREAGIMQIALGNADPVDHRQHPRVAKPRTRHMFQPDPPVYRLRRDSE